MGVVVFVGKRRWLWDWRAIDEGKGESDGGAGGKGKGGGVGGGVGGGDGDREIKTEQTKCGKTSSQQAPCVFLKR